MVFETTLTKGLWTIHLKKIEQSWCGVLWQWRLTLSRKEIASGKANSETLAIADAWFVVDIVTMAREQN